MSLQVHDAIRRWQESGLIDADLARSLTDETTEASEEGRRRFTQYALATTATVVVVTASGVFLGWAWPVLNVALRCTILAGVAVLVGILGLGLERRTRWIPVAYLLQTASLSLLLISFIYSESAFADQGTVAMITGLASLAVPVLSMVISVPRNPFMPAVETAFGYAFLYVFLDRTTPLDWQSAIWVLDGVLLLSLAVFAWRTLRGGAGGGWALYSLVASLFAGLVLVLLTGVGPLGVEEAAAYGVDVWLCVIVAVTLWGIHGAPGQLRRAWYQRLLGVCLLLAIPLTLWTVTGPMGGATEAAAVALAVIGAVGLWYGSAQRFRSVILTSCATLVLAAWYYGVLEQGALGAVVALAFTGALLFWIAGRMGRETADEA